MDIKEILSKVDHTLLKQTANLKDIIKLCDEAMLCKTASICIPPCYVKDAKNYIEKIRICTVIGFPNGYNSTNIKVMEAYDAVNNGADEIDMVINIGYLKEKRYKEIKNEINFIKNAIGDRILKVIIETCLLDDEEKIEMCKVISESNAQYIKTSTGFSKSGATKEDVKLIANHVSDNIRIKAAGGISSIEDAEDFINLGASRLGTSRIVKIYLDMIGNNKI